MKNIYLKSVILVISIAFIISCSKDDAPENSGTTKKEVIENYANIAFANYTQAYNDAIILKTAIATFTANPSQATFTEAKNKWKQARESYGTTEAFRIANGPIDDDNGPEALMNAWPLDENFVDYVAGASTAGIINATTTYPTISKTLLIDLNENGGEKNISVGYHAIEFLLWGQDATVPAVNLPGQRPYTDYVVGGTALNQARRATYLNVCADLLTDNLQEVVNEWKVGGTYRTTFLNLSENVAIRNMYLGITTLISAELPIERMNVALGNADQEDEHSCFSDNTHRDISLNLQGVINIYQGKYGSIDGASLEDLVTAKNATINSDTTTSLNLSVTKVAALQTPFDLAISGGLASVEGQKVRAAVLQLQDSGSNLLAGATSIGITVN